MTSALPNRPGTIAAPQRLVLAETYEVVAARALELQVGKARVAVALDRIHRILETTCAHVPTSHPLVRGIAFADGRPLVCVFLGRNSEQLSVDIKAVVLVAPGGVSWALCADHVHGVVTVADRSTKTDGRLPRWLARARTSEGRTLAWLDPSLMIADIGAGAA
ncbi:MAG TPA: chemotaxis protein CheW [Kofleriaceae bacterium]|nr:chemotaxis protein CheW [Kofleriaceae bacterium]